MNLTRWLILIITAIVLLIDVGLLAVLGLNGTISTQLTQWSHEVPFIPFATGFLCGHWFGQGKKKPT